MNTVVKGSNIKSPQQYKLQSCVPAHFNVDCGLFVIQCADFLSDNLPLMGKNNFPNVYFNQEGMRTYRMKVGADIVRRELNYPI